MSITETEIIKDFIQAGSKAPGAASSQSGSQMKSRLEKLQQVTQQSAEFQKVLVHWGAFTQTLKAQVEAAGLEAAGSCVVVDTKYFGRIWIKDKQVKYVVDSCDFHKQLGGVIGSSKGVIQESQIEEGHKALEIDLAVAAGLTKSAEARIAESLKAFQATAVKLAKKQPEKHVRLDLRIGKIVLGQAAGNEAESRQVTFLVSPSLFSQRIQLGTTDPLRRSSKGAELKIQQRLTTKSLNNSQLQSEFASFKRDPADVLSLKSSRISRNSAAVADRMSLHSQSLRQPTADLVSKQFSEVLASIRSGAMQSQRAAQPNHKRLGDRQSQSQMSGLSKTRTFSRRTAASSRVNVNALVKDKANESTRRQFMESRARSQGRTSVDSEILLASQASRQLKQRQQGAERCGSLNQLYRESIQSKQQSNRLLSSSAATSPDGMVVKLPENQPNAMKDLIHHAFLKKHLQLVDHEETEKQASFKHPEKADSTFKRSQAQSNLEQMQDNYQNAQKHVPWKYRRNPISGMQFTQKPRLSSNLQALERHTKSNPGSPFGNSFSFNNFILESQPEAQAYHSFKKEKLHINTNSVVEQAMSNYKTALRQSQERLSFEKLNRKEQIEHAKWLDEQDAKKRRENMRANGEFIQEQIRNKQAEEQKAWQAEQEQDAQLKLDNIEYEKKIFAKHLMIPGSPAAMDKQQQLKEQHQKLIKEKIDRIVSQKRKQKEEDSDYIQNMQQLDHLEHQEAVHRKQDVKHLFQTAWKQQVDLSAQKKKLLREGYL